MFRLKKGQVALEALVVFGILVIGTIVFGLFYVGNVKETFLSGPGLKQDKNTGGGDVFDNIEGSLVYSDEQEIGSSSFGITPITGGGSQSFCGDEVCDPNETLITCPQDCTAGGFTIVCGDGTCDRPTENPINCPRDCGAFIFDNLILILIPESYSVIDEQFSIKINARSNHSSLIINEIKIRDEHGVLTERCNYNGNYRSSFYNIGKLETTEIPNILTKTLDFSCMFDGTYTFSFMVSPEGLEHPGQSSSINKEIIEIPLTLYPVDGKIWFLEHLEYIDTNIETLSGTYTLMRNLDFNNSYHYLYPHTKKNLWTTGVGWKPIGSQSQAFTGSFDGNNNKIINLYINRPTTNRVGFFGHTTNSIIKNLIIENANIFGNIGVGALSGNTSSMGQDSNISNVLATGTIRGRSEVGGLIGFIRAEGAIINSGFEGTVIGSNNRVGGLLGVLGSNVNYLVFNSYSRGTIIGQDYVGGLIGLITPIFSLSAEYYDIISKTHFDGNVSGNQFVGGLIGKSDAEIRYSYSIGRVTGNNFVGGLIGEQTGKVFNSYSRNNIYGSDHSAGFIGNVWNSEIYNSYSSGYVYNRDELLGGFIYSIPPSGINVPPVKITSSYWDIENSTKPSSHGRAIGKTTAHMKTQKTFVDWDFSTVWAIDPEINDGYPYLR